MLRKKVCMLISVQLPFEVRLFHREAKTLAEAGYSVTIIAQCDETKFVDGIRIIGLGKARNRFFRMARTVRIFARALAEKADVYQVQNPELLLWGVLLRLFTRRSVVYDVHEDFPAAVKIRNWIPRYLRDLLSFVVDVYERTLTRFIDCVITADEQISDRFLHGYSKVVTLYNFPRLVYVKQIPRLKRNETLTKTIIHPGSLCAERGADVMLNAFKIVRESVPEAVLLLIGDFTTPYGISFKKRVEEHGLEGSISVVNYLPHEQVLAHIAQSDVGLSLLQPVSKFMKNIPQKVFEYMACGIPSVVSDLPPIRPFIEDSRAGILVSPSDPEKIAEAVIFLLQHPQEAQKMGENGRRAVLEKYNWDQEARKLLALYEELLER